MADPVQSFFHLRRRPFDKDLPVPALWVDDARTEAIDRLVDAVTARQHVLVTGESGVGKNCVLRALNARLSAVHFRTVYVAHNALGRRDFYRQICAALGVQCKLMPATLFAAIQADLQRLAQERVHPVVVFDEAQLMPDASLATLHILANFAWDSAPVVTFILVGLPELHARLKLGIHRSLLTRIAAHVELVPATADQTAAYVRHRLADAGGDPELFLPEAIPVLHEATGGVLRSLDVLADAALCLAAHRNLRRIDRAVVQQALHHTPLR